MRRALLLIAAIGLTVLFTNRASRASDPPLGYGVASRGRPARVTAGGGQSTDSSLATPGFSSKIGSGSVGVSSAGSKNNRTGPNTNDGFHAAGIGKRVAAGIGQDTMDYVPGRTPTYIHIVAGKRVEPMLAARGH